MIKYVEKGYALHQAVKDAGFTLYNLDGVWHSSDDRAVQAIIDSFETNPMAVLESKAAEYISFGVKLSDALTAKFWAQNVASGAKVSTTDLAVLTSETALAEKLLRTGALTQALDALEKIQASFPKYAGICLFAKDQITQFLGGAL